MKLMPNSTIARIVAFSLYGFFAFIILTIVLGLSGALDKPEEAASAKPTVVAPNENQLSGNKKLCDAARQTHRPYKNAVDANTRGEMSDADFIDILSNIGHDLFSLATDVDTPESSIDDNIAQAGLRWSNLPVLIREGKDLKSIELRIADGIVLWDTAAKECASIGH